MTDPAARALTSTSASAVIPVGDTGVATFLRQQLDAIEQQARSAAAGVGPMSFSEGPAGPTWTADDGLVIGVVPLWDCEGAKSLCMGAATAEHIAYWDPARVLAWCEVVRGLIELPVSASEFPDYEGGYATAWEDMLRIVATLFSDSPDYQAVWRP